MKKRQMKESRKEEKERLEEAPGSPKGIPKGTPRLSQMYFTCWQEDQDGVPVYQRSTLYLWMSL